MLVLYGAKGAPNPRRVEIFLAEHNLELNYVEVSMARGEHKSGGRYETPNQKIPMLTIPAADGRGIVKLAESVAICRYLEEAVASGTLRLFGETAMERATVEMWSRRCELELMFGGVSKEWDHGPVLAPLARRMKMVQHVSELELGFKLSSSFLSMMDRELATRPWVAGSSFSIADITLLCVLDFAAGPVNVPMQWDTWPCLKAWHQKMERRPSVQKHPNPYLQGTNPYRSAAQAKLKAAL